MPLARLRSAVAALTALAVAVLSVLPAEAEGRRVSLIRDAEAEALIRDYARPLLKAAGLGGANVEVKIVSDGTFNAFVADNRHIFVNAGTIIQCETPNELIGVIAHEIGHLAGNHLTRLREAITKAQILTAIAMIGGGAAAAIGSAAGVEGAGRGGAAVALGGVQMGQRSILAYQRGEEASADAAALTYLAATGQSPKGLLDTFERLADHQLFALAGADPYTFSHPLAADRIAALEESARKSPVWDKADDPGLVARHALVRAKFLAFTASAQTTQRRYPATDTSLAADYARAVMAYRFADPKSAVAAADRLIAAAPKNPFFHELKGQILLETGSPAAAVAPLRKAVSLAPKAGVIRVMLGHALVATEDPKLLKEAIEMLTKGLGDDPDEAIGYRQLAIAHARSGNVALADLATAQGAFAAGDITEAKQYAMRAQANLKRGSPAWLRADDIVSYKAPDY